MNGTRPYLSTTRGSKLGDSFKLPSILENNSISDGVLRKSRSPAIQVSRTADNRSGRHSSPSQRFTHSHTLKVDNNHSDAERISAGNQKADSNVNSVSKQKVVSAPLHKVDAVVFTEKDISKQQRQTGYAGITTKERDSRRGQFATTWANTRVNENTTRSTDKANKTDTRITTKNDNSNASPNRKNQFHFVESTRKVKSQKINEEHHNSPSQVTRHNICAVNTDIKDDQEKRDTKTETSKLTKLALDKERVPKNATPRQKWNDNIRREKIIFEMRSKKAEQPLFKPNINKPFEVFTVYTGLNKTDLRHINRRKERPMSDNSELTTETPNYSSKNSSPVSSVIPRNRQEYILTPREAQAYINMHSAYDGGDIQKQRKLQLLNKLSAVQLAFIKNHNEKIKQREKQRQESKQRQYKQLTYLRQKFQQEQWRRFRTQYVTHRVVEHEIMNRYEYGLPDEDDGEVKHSAKIKRKKLKLIENITEKDLRKRNEKNYEKMFNTYNHSSVYRRDKVPKMEGIDTIVILEKDKNGNIIEKKKKVAEIIHDAEKDIKLCDQSDRTKTKPKKDKKRTGGRQRNNIFDINYDDDDEDVLSRSLDSVDLDDDDDDIFERARKKYGLDVESSLDTNSRIY